MDELISTENTENILQEEMNQVMEETYTFTQLEVWYLNDVLWDYLQIVRNTQVQFEEFKKTYEKMIDWTMQLPEWVTLEQVEDESKKIDNDIIHIQTAESRVQELLMKVLSYLWITSDASEESESTEWHTETDDTVSESVHPVSEEDTSVLSGQDDEADIPTGNTESA